MYPQNSHRNFSNINITFLYENLVKTQNRKLVHNKNVLFQKHFLKPSSFLLSFFFVPHDDGVATASVEFGQQIFHFCVLKSLFNLTFLTVLIINNVWEEKIINNSNHILFQLNTIWKLIEYDKHMTFVLCISHFWEIIDLYSLIPYYISFCFYINIFVRLSTWIIIIERCHIK